MAIDETSSSKHDVTSQPQEVVSGPCPERGDVYMTNTQRERTGSPSRYSAPPISLTSRLKKKKSKSVESELFAFNVFCWGKNSSF